jgi:hypothetical protein
MRPMKPPSSPAVETAIVDVIEEPVPGETVVTESEAPAVREPSAGPERPEEGQGSAPPESEGP